MRPPVICSPVQPLPALGQSVIDQLVALLVLLANRGQSLQALTAAQLQGALNAFPNALEVEAGVGVPVQPPALWEGLGPVMWLAGGLKFVRLSNDCVMDLISAPLRLPALRLDGDLMHPLARPLRFDDVAESLRCRRKGNASAPSPPHRVQPASPPSRRDAVCTTRHCDSVRGCCAVPCNAGASGSGQQEDEGQGQREQEVIAERRQVIKAALRSLVEAARPDLSPEGVDAVVAQVSPLQGSQIPHLTQPALPTLTPASPHAALPAVQPPQPNCLPQFSWTSSKWSSCGIALQVWGGGGLSATFPPPLSDPTNAADEHACVEQPKRRWRSKR
ncbi:hypothetical protein HaLaN_15325 [Haematococcus lacustris]|uniref:Uncharacterized protein n=1 Tax=Haematococcus lacustris TaxID=44745 RepID=A0A699ZHF9_HAELA|nr:hypothetical protein HaLaN_15325 [Haematococcus lacustris]